MSDPLPPGAFSAFEVALINEAARTIYRGTNADAVVIVIARGNVIEAMPFGGNRKLAESILERFTKSFVSDGAIHCVREQAPDEPDQKGGDSGDPHPHEC